MNEQSSVSKPSYNSPHKDVEGFDSLAELALDLHWLELGEVALFQRNDNSRCKMQTGGDGLYRQTACLAGTPKLLAQIGPVAGWLRLRIALI